MLDFLGRVKDKAGNLERTIKEKDRHGKIFYSDRVDLFCSQSALYFRIPPAAYGSKYGYSSSFQEKVHNGSTFTSMVSKEKSVKSFNDVINFLFAHA